MTPMPSPTLALRRIPTAEVLELQAPFLRDQAALEALIRRVRATMPEVCPDYPGGWWEAHALEDGTWFLAPASEAPMHLQDGEGLWHRVSPQAVGVVATILALREMAPPAPDYLSLVLFLNALEVWAEVHPDADAIFSALEGADEETDAAG